MSLGSLAFANLHRLFFVSAAHFALLDTPDAINSGNSKLLMIFVGFCAVAFVTIAIAVVVLVLELLKTRTRLMQIVEELHGRAVPFINQTHTLVNDLTPKIKDISANVQHISFVVRDKIEEFEPTLSAANVTVKDANAKTHEQIVRVNEMITQALNKTTEAAEKVERGVKVPFREAAGVWTGLKVGVETFLSGRKRRPAPRYTGAPYAAEPHTPAYKPSPADPYVSQATMPATAAAEAAAAAFARAEQRNPNL